MIEFHEHSLVGRWLSTGGGVSGDPACRRIEALVSGHLLELARTDGGWRTLYRDPHDGRLWERSYPQGELHGGGPPALHCVTLKQARAVYGYEA
ncbi:Imm27 family immunity protein [Lysobacter korlensis]|uniref:Imm27 family immunity protein n=1 Tax=Lysobacter korlensis TaxID=553636 RepID=A0ABV6S0X8_9GAMM